MDKPALPIALTMGDPAGIGLDVSIHAWLERQRNRVPPFLLLACPQTLEKRAVRLGVELPIAVSSPGKCHEDFEEFLPVFPLKSPVNEEPGIPRVSDSSAVIESIKTAFGFCMDGLASAVVTNPITKKTLYDSGFKHPGHTEFLRSLALETTNRAHESAMLLVAPELKTSPVTLHLPLADVAGSLTKSKIVKLAEIICNELIRRFNTDNPRLAVVGLNPHAGEGGSLGMEEIEIIRPAIEALQAGGIDASGPFPADTLFREESRQEFDCILTMYHDQALIPIKALDFERTVNVTAGLPVVRTSPAHGTALELAGSGKANCTSLVEAMRLAKKLKNAEGAD